MRRALVTGGSGAIGAAICRRLAAAGHHVYVHAHGGGARAAQVVTDIEAAGGSAQPIMFDVTDADSTGRALETLLAEGD
ncbi:MAG TPA: SDR family NAD(P)-dependent oxidoreductase, partial [Stellaceae bacterium]|nr:SDR family NAD(P)-dependent oxidoreductase [Stellaceae bacterium]